MEKHWAKTSNVKNRSMETKTQKNTTKMLKFIHSMTNPVFGMTVLHIIPDGD